MANSQPRPRGAGFFSADFLDATFLVTDVFFFATGFLVSVALIRVTVVAATGAFLVVDFFAFVAILSPI